MTRPLPLPASQPGSGLAAGPASRSASAFDWKTRVLCCAECGAPLEAAVAGGLVRCGYCRSTNVIERHDKRDHRSARRLPRPALEEVERIDRLRRQVGVALEVPLDLRRFLAAGQIEARFVSQLLRDWLATHQRLRRNQAAFDGERLFHLTLLIAPRLDPQKRRALLETALEALILPRYQQLLRGELAREAALEGNAAAAASWLEPCDPYAADLHMDSAYRLGAAYLAAARDDRAEILALLGGREGEVPIAPERVDEAEVLRIHACERLVGQREAGARLAERLDDAARLGGMLSALRAGFRIRLCGDTWPPLELSLFGQWADALRAPPEIQALWVAIACLILEGVGIGALLVWSIGDGLRLGLLLVTPTLLVTLAMVNSRARIENLRRLGELSIAHLCSSFSRDFRPSLHTAPDPQRFTLEVAIETRDGPVRVAVRRTLFAPGGRGSYPVLYDPTAPHNCRILVQGSAADALELLRPLPSQDGQAG